MPTLRVGKHLDVVEYVSPCFFPRTVEAAAYPLPFQQLEEALRHGVEMIWLGSVYGSGGDSWPPQQNAYIESFNGKFRGECLNEHWFISMWHAQQVLEQWRQEYNGERPNSSLGYLTPNKFGESFLTADSMSISN